MLAAVAFAVDGAPVVAWTPRFVGSLGFLALAGTALAFLLWFEEVRRAALGPLTAWTLLVPVFGVLFGIALLDERLSPRTAIGLVLVIGALAATLTPYPTSRSGGPPGASPDSARSGSVAGHSSLGSTE